MAGPGTHGGGRRPPPRDVECRICFAKVDASKIRDHITMAHGTPAATAAPATTPAPASPPATTPPAYPNIGKKWLKAASDGFGAPFKLFDKKQDNE